MNKSIGTSANFMDVTGTELSGIIIMMFTSIIKGRVEDELYVIMTNKKYHTVRTIIRSHQLYSKFSKIDIPDNVGDLHHHFSYQKLREMFGYKRGEFGGTISISIYSVVSGTVSVKDNAYNNCSTISITYGEKKTQFSEMGNDTLPKNQPYQILTGKVNPWDRDSEKEREDARYCYNTIPNRFFDPNPQRNEFYMTSDTRGSSTFKPLKFYVGMVTPAVNCKTLTVFKDPRGRAFIADISKKSLVAIPDEHLFVDSNGTEWIVDTSVKGNLERYTDPSTKKNNFTLKEFYPPVYTNTSSHKLVDTQGPRNIEVSYSIGDVFGNNCVIIGIYLLKNVLDDWSIRYLIAPLMSCDKTHSIVIDQDKVQCVSTPPSTYKSNVMDTVYNLDNELSTNEIKFHLPNKVKIMEMIYNTDNSYLTYEDCEHKCGQNTQRFNSLCYGKNEAGRYCMTPVHINGDFCDKHGGRQTNLRKCGRTDCGGIEPMGIEHRRSLTSIYKLYKTSFTRYTKFMYGVGKGESTNIDVCDTLYYWKKL